MCMNCTPMERQYVFLQLVEDLAERKHRLAVDGAGGELPIEVTRR